METSINVDIHSMDIAKKWADFCVKEKFPNPEFVFQFMSRWVAFNYLYSKYYEKAERHLQSVYKEQYNGFVSECDMIEQLIKYAYNEIKDIDYYSVDNIDYLFELPVYSGSEVPTHEDYIKWFKDRNGKQKHERELKLFKKLNNASNERKLVALFKTIYQVRCNLFHANKLPSDVYDRDRKLIQISNDIMALYIDRLIEIESEHYL